MARLAALLVVGLALGRSAALAQDARLTLVLRSDVATEIRVGDPIPLTFVVSNVGSGTYEYIDRNYDRSGRMPEFTLAAVDDRGAAVPDPRTVSRAPRGYIGGGIGGFAKLLPSARFEKTILLNVWALIARAGAYTVRGTYRTDKGWTLESPPLTVQVLPRTDADMGRLIDDLGQRLRAATNPEERAALVRRLMFTCDRRAAAPLLAFSAQPPGNAGFWIGEAFAHYLPKDAAMLTESVTAIRRAGLREWSLTVLEQLEAPVETIIAIIGESLTNGDELGRADAALAAQRYPSDHFEQALIRLATTGSDLSRRRAIYALASNRTDAGVATLAQLRHDADPSIRKATAMAIESLYRQSASSRGRPLRPEDFPDLARPPRH